MKGKQCNLPSFSDVEKAGIVWIVKTKNECGSFHSSVAKGTNCSSDQPYQLLPGNLISAAIWRRVLMVNQHVWVNGHHGSSWSRVLLTDHSHPPFCLCFPYIGKREKPYKGLWGAYKGTLADHKIFNHIIRPIRPWVFFWWLRPDYSGLWRIPIV